MCAPERRVGDQTLRQTEVVTLRPTEIRRAELSEASEVADLWLRSRRASIPAIPAPVHSDDDVHDWFLSVVIPKGATWVIDGPARIVAMISLDRGWIDQLYVDPDETGRGLGSTLIGFAKQQCAEGLNLWTFQSNSGARRFYERHGFVSVETTEGDNEEQAPDAHYRWRGK
jgi:GNAT superfamily N-acetyltransferase